jgi:hypothetical protein
VPKADTMVTSVQCLVTVRAAAHWFVRIAKDFA